MKTALFTIGYEGRALDEVLAALAKAKVDRLIDIRELPLSRRPGFSKTPLREALQGAGIEYLHLRSAGNPFRKDPDGVAKYREHLPPQAVDDVAEAARGHRAALLCYEADVTTCHRSILAPHVGKALGVTVRDL
jgi:uncharacterized protein (DUF488 family)